MIGNDPQSVKNDRNSVLTNIKNTLLTEIFSEKNYHAEALKQKMIK